ncbi:MAG: NAD(P)-dependent oxidoreductase [Campylobacterota bacterium]
MALGFIGLGNLGSAIVKRLHEQGRELVVYNRSTDKARQSGFAYAKTPKELATQCDTIMICLFDSGAVEEVLHNDDGLLAADIKGKTIIDLSTHHFEKVPAFHETLAAQGASYLECPVYGSVGPALKGVLTVVTSGKQDVHENNQALLSDIANDIFHLPQPGAATKMKLINNLCLGSFMATIAECTALGEACDIDKSKLLEILGAGGGQSLVLSAKTQKLIEEDFDPHFSNAAINKDLHNLQDLAYSMDRPLYSAAVPKELFSQMKKKGEGQKDFSSIYKLFT